MLMNSGREKETTRDGQPVRGNQMEREAETTRQQEMTMDNQRKTERALGEGARGPGEGSAPSGHCSEDQAEPWRTLHEDSEHFQIPTRAGYSPH